MVGDLGFAADSIPSMSSADMGVYNELCKIANQDFPQLFY